MAVFSDNTTALAYLKKQVGTRSATLNTMAQSVLRFCEESHIRLLPQFIPGKMNVLADSESQKSGHRFQLNPLCGGISSSSSPLAGHHRPLCNLPQSPAACLFLSDGGLSVSGHRRHASELGRPSGLCLPFFRFPFSGTGEGPAVQRVGADVNSSILATASLVPGPSGGDSLLPVTTGGSSQTAPLPSLSSEPPRTSADCLAYLHRSMGHSGFSLAVARQLTLCRRRSTCLNYQAKWAVYRAWCHRHGHPVSRPSVSKVADFLLYLRRSLSLSLSYSSIASYRSMLSGVFRFLLHELSSHFVLHDLLRSFCLERPLPSSRVPPWDLLLVLRFLRGPPFEPLSSCSLWDLTQKVLFLVPWLPLAVLGNCRLSLGMFLFLAPTSISHICLSFVRRRSRLLTLFLALSVFVLSRISLVTFLMSFFSVLSALSVYIFLVCPRFLLVLALCLSLLGLLLGLSLRMLLASFFGTSSLGHTPLLLLRLLLPPRLCLPLQLQLFVLTVSVGLLLLGPPLVTLLFLLSWRLLLGLPFLC